MENESPSVLAQQEPAPAQQEPALNQGAGNRFMFIPFNAGEDVASKDYPSIRVTAALYKEAVQKNNPNNPEKVPIILVEGGLDDAVKFLQDRRQEMQQKQPEIAAKQANVQQATNDLAAKQQEVTAKNSAIQAAKPGPLGRLAVWAGLKEDPAKDLKQQLATLKREERGLAKSVEEKVADLNAFKKPLEDAVRAGEIIVEDCRQSAALLQAAKPQDTVYVMGHSGAGNAGWQAGLSSSSGVELSVDKIASRMKAAVGDNVGKVKVWGCNSGLDLVNSTGKTTMRNGQAILQDEQNLLKSTAVGLADEFSKQGIFNKAAVFGYEDTVTLDPSNGTKQAKVPLARAADKDLVLDAKGKVQNLAPDGKHVYVAASERRVTVRDSSGVVAPAKDRPSPARLGNKPPSP